VRARGSSAMERPWTWRVLCATHEPHPSAHLNRHRELGLSVPLGVVRPRCTSMSRVATGSTSGSTVRCARCQATATYCRPSFQASHCISSRSSNTLARTSAPALSACGAGAPEPGCAENARSAWPSRAETSRAVWMATTRAQCGEATKEGQSEGDQHPDADRSSLRRGPRSTCALRASRRHFVGHRLHVSSRRALRRVSNRPLRRGR
jgi:hypothetical protein